MALLKYLSTVLDLLLPSVHVLFYSVLLGSQLYQSFIVTKVTFAALPRPAFVSLQKRLFPIYFRTQTALIVLTAATFPLGPSALIHSRFDCLPLLAAALPAGLNLAVYGPLTQNAMLERARQGASRNIDADPLEAQDIAILKRRFSFAHAMSIHLNLISLGGTLWYGWQLASRLEYKV